MQVRLATLVGVFAAGLTASAWAQGSAGQVRVTDDFAEGEIRWTRGAPSYSYRMLVRARGGIVEVCGAGAYTRGNVRRETREVLEDRTVLINGEVFLTDFTFFAKVSRPSALLGAEANCRSTAKRVPQAEALEVSIGSTNPGERY